MTYSHIHRSLISVNGCECNFTHCDKIQLKMNINLYFQIFVNINSKMILKFDLKVKYKIFSRIK